MKKLIFVVIIFFIVSCQNKNDNKQEVVNQKVDIKNQWISPSTAKANSAMFFQVINNTNQADTLYGVKCSIDEVSMIHETFTNDDGTTGMRHVMFIEIPPNSKIEFKPGGLHVMLMNLKSDLNENDTVDVTLQFKKSGDINIKVPVKEIY
ncbi:copper chaperone PCu(A)C [Melioribacteraceae bacterium 4301-Me]|uniref:copper chaperone PCu(A)C n=1 Tax=Pyranulibacter aquaticus TaxID=3163344 RepID=UPI00359B133E